MWAKKNDETFYGYKNHVKIDDKSKLIDMFMVSGTSVHDSKVPDILITERKKINHFMPIVLTPAQVMSSQYQIVI